MKTLDYLTQEYEEILETLGRYLEQSRQCDQLCRMEGIRDVLDRIRLLQSFCLNTVHPTLERLSELQSHVRLAQEESDKLEAAIERLIMIHVDEPDDLYVIRVAQVRDVLASMQKIHVEVFSMSLTLLSVHDFEAFDSQLKRARLHTTSAV